MTDLPQTFITWMQPFRIGFTAPAFHHVLVLVAGAVLAPGRRTVAAALRVMGLEHGRHFTNYHRVLNRDRWSSRAVAHRLLDLLVAAFAPTGPVVIGLDDTIERRWGATIAARGIYRDPVRSSKGHFVKASGLRWLSFMLLVPVPWTGRVWALPFLTVLAPSHRHARQRNRRHKPLTDWARQALLQVARWLEGRRIVAVADSGYAAIELLNAVRHHICLITRLRLDARLFAPAPPRRPGTPGRPRVRGQRLPTLAQRLADPATRWRRLKVDGWYGKSTRRIDIATGTALWDSAGRRVPIRYVLVRDGQGEFRPQAFVCTDPEADPLDILRWFVRRWATEVTFAEVRRHLGVETQRQWSDRAIARTTPALLGLFSLVALWANDLFAARPIVPRPAAWYDKRDVTFSDALAAVRRTLWSAGDLRTSPSRAEAAEIPRNRLDRLTDLACYAA